MSTFSFFFVKSVVFMLLSIDLDRMLIFQNNDKHLQQKCTVTSTPADVTGQDSQSLIVPSKLVGTGMSKPDKLSKSKTVKDILSALSVLSRS